MYILLFDSEGGSIYTAGGYYVFCFVGGQIEHLNNVSSLFFFVSKYGIKSNTPTRIMRNESGFLFYVYLVFAASCVYFFNA